MSVFRIKEEVVEITNLVSSNLSIRKMEPRLTEEDQAWAFVINDITKIKFIP